MFCSIILRRHQFETRCLETRHHSGIRRRTYHHLTIRAHLTWRKRMAVLTMGRSRLRYIHSGGVAYWMIGCVPSTEPQLIRGAKALLVYDSAGVARILLLLEVEKSLIVFAIWSLGYCCLSWASQVGHCTELVGCTFNPFALNWGVAEFIKEVLLVILLWLLLRSVVLHFSWNELRHLIGSSFWREGTWFVVDSWLLLIVASKGWVCNSRSHCVLSRPSAVGGVVSRESWLDWFPWRQLRIPGSIHKLCLQYSRILSIWFVVTSATMWLVASRRVTASCVCAFTHLFICPTL